MQKNIFLDVYELEIFMDLACFFKTVFSQSSKLAKSLKLIV